MKKRSLLMVLLIVVVSVMLAGCDAQKSAYNKGVKALEAKEYQKAIDSFTEAGEYMDASDKISEAYYQMGIEALTGEDYQTAISCFEQANGYEDSSDKILEAHYCIGDAAMQKEDYETAIENYKKATGFKDSADKLAECEHKLAVLNDKTPPAFSGIDEVLAIDCGTSFNLNEYLKKNLKISDDVTKDITEFNISCDEKAYDRIGGKVNTCNSGKFQTTVTAKDEAGNEGEFTFDLQLDPIHVTKDNLTPVVYDGEYGKIQLLKSEHGYIDYIDEFRFTFEVENKTDDPMDIYFGTSYTTINGYQINAYYTDISIGAGNKGKAEIHIYDEDIPDDIGTIEQIVTKLCINNGGEESYFQIPMIIDVNVTE